MAKLLHKSRVQLLSALEDHLHLFRGGVESLLGGDAAHVRVLAAQLRALLCVSSGVRGLLWRARDEVGVSDIVTVNYPGKLNEKHPLAQGIYFAFAAPGVGGSASGGTRPLDCSFFDHFHSHECCYIDGFSVTREYLVSRLANEVGVAHEAYGVSKEMAKLNAVLMRGIQAYISVLDDVARTTLRVGEAIIEKAVAGGYVRRRGPLKRIDHPGVQSVEFLHGLELPSQTPDLQSGTIALVLDIRDLDRLGLDGGCRFQSFSFGKVLLNFSIRRRGRISLETFGLPLPYFGFWFSIVAQSDDDVAIAISWKGLVTKGYARGQLMAGPVGEL